MPASDYGYRQNVQQSGSLVAFHKREMTSGEELLNIERAFQEGDGVHNILYDGVQFPCRLQKREDSSVLVILFHGAVNRNVRPVPAFAKYHGKVGDYYNILSVSDPTMMVDNVISTGWYGGTEEVPVQRTMVKFLSQFISHVGASRVIFSGGSGGGYAALYYSWFFPSSIALVMNPQTSIIRYRGGQAAENYMKQCWPGISRLSDLEKVMDADVCKIYSRGFKNKVVYIQSIGDRHHASMHMSPFLASVGQEIGISCLLDCSFWNKIGHGGSIPPERFNRWLRACALAPDTQAENLLGLFLAPERGDEVPFSKQDDRKESGDQRRNHGSIERDVLMNELLNQNLLSSCNK